MALMTPWRRAYHGHRLQLGRPMIRLCSIGPTRLVGAALLVAAVTPGVVSAQPDPLKLIVVPFTGSRVETEALEARPNSTVVPSGSDNLQVPSAEAVRIRFPSGLQSTVQT